MSRRATIAIGAAILGVGLLVLVALAFTTRGNVRTHIRNTYATAPAGTSEASLAGAAVFVSMQPPSQVANDIAGKWRPAQRHTDAAGHFLRYRNDIVAVTSDGGTGSRIVVDDTARGYTRWYPYIGGYWGTYSGGGPGGGFRGGGPGSGK